jgi:hypothetical protein
VAEELIFHTKKLQTTQGELHKKRYTTYDDSIVKPNTEKEGGQGRE